MDEQVTTVLPAVSPVSTVSTVSTEPAGTAGTGQPVGSPADQRTTRELRPGPRDFAAGVVATDRPARRPVTGRLFAWAATVLFAGFSMLFLLTTPPLYAPDEAWQFDRVMGAANGEIVVPIDWKLSVGGASIQTFLGIPSSIYVGTDQLSEVTPKERAARPSLNEAGGNVRQADAPVNYMAQHPPLYYALMGGVAAIVPGGSDLNVDVLLFVLRFANILLVLPLPWLFHLAARNLVGPGVVANAAAFLPLLVPGLARSAASINNDNLAVLIGAALALVAIKVMRGDRSVATATWAAGLCVAGALTKGTMLIVLLVIPAAYVVQVVSRRQWPRVGALVALGIGAVLAAVWPVRNVLLYGKVQPDGWSVAQRASMQPPRGPDSVMDMGRFWGKVFKTMTSRFWGSLGVLEPPSPPLALVIVLNTLCLLAALLALVVLRRRRAPLVVFYVQFTVFMAAVVLTAYRVYQRSPAIPGLQGRYAYPLLFAATIGVPIALGWLLRGAGRWTAAIVAITAVVLQVWFYLIMFSWLFLEPGRNLGPSTFVAGVRRLISWGPLPGALTAGLLVFTGVVVLIGMALTVRAVARSPRADCREEYAAELERTDSEVPIPPVEVRV